MSSHFDYHVNLMSGEETIKLNLLTYNKRHDEYMLFHTVKGKSSIECLERMLAYIEEHHDGGDEKSYTITWSKKGDSETVKSYFMADSEEEAIEKFLHEKNADDYDYSCELNPLS